MALHAAAVEILIEKGRFEPEVALGIAEAIEASVMQAQFVTVPILDARLQDVKAETRIGLIELEGKIGVKLEQTKAELVRWVFLAMLGNIAVAAGATALLNAFKNL